MKTQKVIKNQSYKLINNQDIFESSLKRINAQNNGATVIVPHVCNNIDLFGAGFAGQVAEKYPEVKSNYHLLGKSFLKSNLGHSQFITVREDKQYRHRMIFVNMIAQNGIISHTNPRPLNYAALCRAMIGVSQYINMNTGFLNKSETVEIHAPKFGSGLAGGNWNFISDLVFDIWNKYPVFIYNFNQK